MLQARNGTNKVRTREVDDALNPAQERLEIKDQKSDVAVSEQCYLKECLWWWKNESKELVRLKKRNRADCRGCRCQSCRCLVVHSANYE